MIEFLPLIIAGLLTTLSPCVLPVLPFVIASSLSKNRLGPIVLSLGLLTTFVTSTLLISLSGRFLGLEPYLLKKIAALFLILGGLLFVFNFLQEKFSAFLSRFLPTQSNSQSGGLKTEFTGGMILGMIWTPCSGPSLGVALGLASQAETALQAFIMLLIFGFAAVAPLLIVAYGARKIMTKLREKATTMVMVKKAFGFFMILFGIMIFFSLEYKIEAIINQALPENWLRFLMSF